MCEARYQQLRPQGVGNATKSRYLLDWTVQGTAATAGKYSRVTPLGTQRTAGTEGRRPPERDRLEPCRFSAEGGRGRVW